MKAISCGTWHCGVFPVEISFAIDFIVWFYFLQILLMYKAYGRGRGGLKKLERRVGKGLLGSPKAAWWREGRVGGKGDRRGRRNHEAVPQKGEGLGS